MPLSTRKLFFNTHMCRIHTLIQGRLLRIIYIFQLVNIKNCTFKALPTVVLRYGTLSILTFAIRKV